MHYIHCQLQYLTHIFSLILYPELVDDVFLPYELFHLDFMTAFSAGKFAMIRKNDNTSPGAVTGRGNKSLTHTRDAN